MICKVCKHEGPDKDFPWITRKYKEKSWVERRSICTPCHKQLRKEADARYHAKNRKKVNKRSRDIAYLKYNNDPEHRQKLLDRKNELRRERYANDPEYRRKRLDKKAS